MTIEQQAAGSGQQAAKESPAVERVYLVGPRGSGKSTVGRVLAGRLGWMFIDADDALEKSAGRTIAELFDAEGEAGFRVREADLLGVLAKRERHVIACGGGVVLRPSNRQLLRATGLCIWLTGDSKILCERLSCDPTTATRRPALTELPALAEIERLLREREPLYREVAHLTIATDGRSPADVVSAILNAWPTSALTCP
jgi:shikimate kinase